MRNVRNIQSNCMPFTDCTELVCAEEYAKAASIFIRSGTDIDFTRDKVVGIGHSVGAVSM